MLATVSAPRTRRPIGCRPNTPEEDARRDAEGRAGDLMTFEYREEAAAHARTLAGWIAHPQYAGFLDLWTIVASRKSWGYRKAPVCLRADGSLR